jgi:hypothetical protein
MHSPLLRNRVRLLIRYSVLMVLLLVALSACGRSREAAANPTPTAIATLAVEEPTATPEPAPTDTPAPAATPTEVETGAEAETEAETPATTEAEAITETASLTATEAMTGVEAITETETITETEGVTETEEITSSAEMTEEVSPSEEVTATEEMTATDEVTATTAISEPGDITETEEITSTGITPSPEVTATTGLTDTEAITESEEMTDSEAISESEEITETAEVAEEEEAEEAITAADEITATEEITSGEEITATEELSPTEESMEQGDIDDSEAMTETERLTTPETLTETSEATVHLFFVQPTDHAILPENSTVVVDYEGLELQPEGESAEAAAHLYLLIDADFVEADEVMPEDESYVRLDAAANGELTTAITLTPGLHLLRLQFTDADQRALEGDEYRCEIAVRVVEGAPEQSVRFAMPTDGAVVPPAFDVSMAAAGLLVEPSGPAREDAGHFHILVDEDFLDEGESIPKDETHLHYDMGELTATLELEPGEHVLRLQFADGAHAALDGDEFGDVITVTVEEDAPAQQVMFVEPQDGDTVPPSFMLRWAAAGLIIEPAGPVLAEGRGHLHVLVDEEFADAGEIVLADATHLHYGAGQTSTEMTLEPGEHTLRLQMADGAHRAREGDQYQDEITITVAEE